jgi:hypothetical protein
MESMMLASLPVELLLIVATYLNFYNFTQLSSVNSALYQHCSAIIKSYAVCRHGKQWKYMFPEHVRRNLICQYQNTEMHITYNIMHVKSEIKKLTTQNMILCRHRNLYAALLKICERNRLFSGNVCLVLVGVAKDVIPLSPDVTVGMLARKGMSNFILYGFDPELYECLTFWRRMNVHIDQITKPYMRELASGKSVYLPVTCYTETLVSYIQKHMNVCRVKNKLFC